MHGGEEECILYFGGKVTSSRTYSYMGVVGAYENGSLR
jgi:hypothetical protein